MNIALATDHAGFELLRQLEAFLAEQGHQCVDYGPKTRDPTDDYPDFIIPAAKAVASGKCEMGVILGGSGQGEAMAANRVNGVRCAVYYGGTQPSAVAGLEGGVVSSGQDIVRLSREHNDANMLSLGARFLSEAQARQAVTLWLSTRFSGEERHKRRIEKLDQTGDAQWQQQFAPQS